LGSTRSRGLFLPSVGAKLIAGPTVYICDLCISEAGALFGSARA
jgi:hypothetical protein